MIIHHIFNIDHNTVYKTFIYILFIFLLKIINLLAFYLFIKMDRYINCLLPKSEATIDGYIWYLAYGSNMNENVLTKFRGINYIKSYRVKIPNY